MASKTLQELTSRLADAFGFSRLFKFRPAVEKESGCSFGRGGWLGWQPSLDPGDLSVQGPANWVQGGEGELV